MRSFILGLFGVAGRYSVGFWTTFIGIVFCLIPGSLAAQDSWQLVTKKEEITVYSQSVPGSKIKALKVECLVDASVMQVVALLLDVEAGTDWVYKTKSCQLPESFTYGNVLLLRDKPALAAG